MEGVRPENLPACYRTSHTQAHVYLYVNACIIVNTCTVVSYLKESQVDFGSDVERPHDLHGRRLERHGLFEALGGRTTRIDEGSHLGRREEGTRVCMTV